MASVDKENCFTLTWKIENISYFRPPPPVKSLEFPAWQTKNTSGNMVENEGGKLNKYRCEMFLLTSCDEIPLSDYILELDVGEIHCCSIKRSLMIGEAKDSIIPQDALTFHCKIWHQSIQAEKCIFHTILHEVNFLWKCEQERYQERTVHHKDDVMLVFNVWKSFSFENIQLTHAVQIDVQSTIGRFATFVGCELSIEDGSGRVISQIHYFPSVNLHWYVNINKNNSNFTLGLKSVVAVHMEHQELQEPSALLPVRPTNTLNEDLLNLYKEKKLSDATLNVEGKSFSAHKSILASRSPVFCAMFEKEETTEGRSGVVDIDDLDEETVQRMLNFMYSDNFENLRWEEAFSLYYAADKYAILPLKQKCLEILKAGLAIDNACDALTLADRHSDEELMKFTVDFIRDHEDVISSSEWSELEKANSPLTSKVLREVILKKTRSQLVAKSENHQATKSPNQQINQKTSKRTYRRKKKPQKIFLDDWKGIEESNSERN